MPTTLITTPTFARHSARPWQILEEAGAGPLRPREDTALPTAELLSHAAEADALIVGMDPITAEVMDAAPRLKVIAKHGVGVDTIDVAAAHARAIPVVCAPGSNSRAVAEYTFGLLLSAARSLTASHTAVAAGGWPKLFGPELHGRTLGIVGFGRIGRLLAGYARAFGMDLLAHDPYVPEADVRAHGAEPAALDALLARADAVSLHTPPDPSGTPLLDRSRLAAMRPGAIVVNAARGGLVDERALADLLGSGHLGAAALDAFSTEPLPEDHPLREAPRTVLTSHMAACTPEANQAMGAMVAEDVVRVLAGAEPHHPAR
ncbi:phosphoglycerate dehydrogenase [Streptomyces rapamycinicus]|uniref:2-hydroxyacid dehydrogenase n=2 Tax=Streptomyces rapamycinicus TaxID=1226757 RepID=A0A0A0NCK0_STRRN|nr:phosphoglycerate dehydrogenase [Streptomyces rapamycinicus]AGP52170.1 2-hydroxyacid dehydrogenase [Streptomyces rapamycinicus NRRL 5491]MBB4779621.1 D-3-phosphoglycerate dehydrogenase [Streptomyces rapamycinicus]RLV75719.1 2-hydroxyacid dehydrogenase [Streptomyces rapamycinicus NRRL 5491]UTP28373.1 phosphoglycerate dehydrogenase [Streptomyces rapamycinicus NRRL 5491]